MGFTSSVSSLSSVCQGPDVCHECIYVLHFLGQFLSRQSVGMTHKSPRSLQILKLINGRNDKDPYFSQCIHVIEVKGKAIPVNRPWKSIGL
jgi:hypothetical protein